MATRTYTHLYESYDEAIRTVQALEAAGVSHGEISLVANNVDNRAGTTAGTGYQATAADTVDEGAETKGAGTGATVGTVLGGGAGLLAGLGMLAIPGVGPVVAAGWLIATLTGAGVGAAGGGLLGSLVGGGVPEEHAHTYAEGMRRGGTLVTVRADDRMASRIEGILEGRATAAVDVTARRADYHQSGWTGFNETAPVVTSADVQAERSRYVRVS